VAFLDERNALGRIFSAPSEVASNTPQSFLSSRSNTKRSIPALIFLINDVAYAGRAKSFCLKLSILVTRLQRIIAPP
jgi:hypothetical protein